MSTGILRSNVTLSGLHSLIKTHSEEADRLWQRARNIESTFSFRIFEKTTEEQLVDEQKRMIERRNQFIGLCQDSLLHSAYVGYLKTMLQKANNRNGIAELLQKVKDAAKRRDQLRSILAFAMSGATPFEAIQDVATYKSAFTSENRTYNVTASIFSSKDVEKMKEMIDEAERAIVELNHSIALMNQTKRVSIADFDGDWDSSASAFRLS